MKLALLLLTTLLLVACSSTPEFCGEGVTSVQQCGGYHKVTQAATIEYHADENGSFVSCPNIPMDQLSERCANLALVPCSTNLC